MVKNIFYCREWNDILNSPMKPFTVAKAKERHNKGEPYCVVIEIITGERIIVDCTADSYYVLFFDAENRRSLSYHFEKVNEEKVFLSKAWFPQYFGQSNKIEKGEVYHFKKNGEVNIVKSEPKGKNRYESNSIQNVERNYAAIPQFGNYESIIKRER